MTQVKIEVLNKHIVYENPNAHAYWPNITQLPSGDLLALFVLRESLGGPDYTTYVARSRDLGHTWDLEGPLYDKSVVEFPTSDSMKAAALSDGSLVAVGYRFHRRSRDEANEITLTNGIQPGDNLAAFSSDEGRTWTEPSIISTSYPELLETSGPCIELRLSGDLLASSCPYPMQDGTTPSGHIGVLLRSTDKGRIWGDQTLFFTTPEKNVSPYESRICEMQDGRIVALVWAYDELAEKNLPNLVTVSHDSGYTWSEPIDTGVKGQASNLMWLEGDRLLTIHAHREGDVGLVVRLVDFADDQWNVIAEKSIWTAPDYQNREGSIVEVWRSIKFGQPSLIRLSNGDLLAYYWQIENGQARIISHGLAIRPTVY